MHAAQNDIPTLPNLRDDIEWYVARYSQETDQGVLQSLPSKMFAALTTIFKLADADAIRRIERTLKGAKLYEKIYGKHKAPPELHVLVSRIRKMLADGHDLKAVRESYIMYRTQNGEKREAAARRWLRAIERINLEDKCLK